MGSSINMETIIEVCEELWERQRDLPPPPLVGIHSWYWRHRRKSKEMELRTKVSKILRDRKGHVDIACLEDVQNLFAEP